MTIRTVRTGYVGRQSPRFALFDTEGQRHSSEDYRGHWLLLVFHRHLG